jgi:hypothetical protein
MCRVIATTAKVLTVILLFFSVLLAHAQGSPALLQISYVDISSYPEISILFHALDQDDQPLSGLTAPDIIIYEDQQLVDFSLASENTGLRVVFVIDAGIGVSNSSGSTGQPRLDEMKAAIESYLVTMDPMDSVMILTQEGTETRTISNFSSSTSELRDRIANYQPNPPDPSFGLLGINRAITELSNFIDGKSSFVVFLSSGLQYNSPEANAEYESFTIQPDCPPVYTVLFRADEGDWNIGLSNISQKSGGNYFFYGRTDSVISLYTELALWRSQYNAVYRSQNGQVGAQLHDIAISNTAGTLQDSITYNIELQLPNVIIQQPQSGTIIERKGSGLSSANYEPTSTIVIASVEWPDNIQRKIVNASLMVDGATAGSVQNPGDRIEIQWDLHGIRRLGDNPVNIQVQVEDELGLTNLSEPIPVTIVVQPSIWPILLQVFAVLLAITAITLVIVFRTKIPGVVSEVGETIGRGWERLTKPRRDLKVKAQLIAIKGEGVNADDQYDLYGTTALGRSKRYADLVFQPEADPEQSPISRKHCTILEDDGIFYLRDEDSQWKTYHNGKKLAPLDPGRVELHDGDIIELAKVERGGIRFRFVSIDQKTTYDDENSTNSDTEYPGGDMGEEAEGRATKRRRNEEQ